MTYDVRLDSTVIATDSTVEFQGWTLKNFSFNATAGNHQLTFIGVSVPAGRDLDQTSFLDAVSVTAVPEPGETAAVVGLGLGAFALLRRNRKAAAR